MNDIKKYIAESIYEVLKNDDVLLDEILNFLEEPKDSNNGDIAYPCFRLSKKLKDTPVNIANKIMNLLSFDERILKVDNVNGYLNFYINNNLFVKDILNNIVNLNFKFDKNNINKNVVLEYSSPNIAKPFHLGHFRTTIIGRALYNIYKELGYNVTNINHLGDWGRQFGLLIEGYRRYKDNYDVNNLSINDLQDIYVKINSDAKDDENVFEIARDNFKKLEDGDTNLLATWQYFKDISMKEYKKIYDLLDCKFDSYNGESFYKDKMGEVVELLDKKGVLVTSNGARVVMMGKNLPPCIIIKSNGSTIYATRDLATVLYRTRTYDYYRSIYVTSYEQSDYFKQIFEVSKYLVDKKYCDGLVHVPYGMVRLKDGKMSSREGTVVYLEDLINSSIEKSKNIIISKNSNISDIEKSSKQIGIGALIFNDLKHNKMKDIVFDLDEVLRFDGETGPYVQYTYARINSILSKEIIVDEDFNYKYNDDEINLIKLLSNYEKIINEAAQNYEPSILTRYIINIASSFSTYYNKTQILVDDKDTKCARLLLIKSISIILKKGLNLLGIQVLDKM
ncbi:MAG: arginine--tRNA ligase [Clostridia bacterium]